MDDAMFFANLVAHKELIEYDNLEFLQHAHRLL